MTPDIRFPHPNRIRYDGQCLTIDGKDTFIFSGAFHYFRCPKELWRDRFRKFKEAGFNAIETYVAWNWHEQERPAGPDDFSKMDLSEFAEWMRMAHEEFGFYSIIRPGPYICSEWEVGGYPRWLLLEKPQGAKYPWLRSDDETYLRWSRHWYHAVCPVIAAEQITRKPAGSAGVILFQIENEYDYAPEIPEKVRVNHLRRLAEDAQRNGIDVPLIACWTRQCRSSKDPLLSQVFDGINLYPRWDMNAAREMLVKVRNEQSHAPVMIPELQGGWFAGVGLTPLSEDQEGLTAEQCHHLTMLSIEYGATITNYYMCFGGTNFGGWGARDMTTTYDYFAPLREWGGTGSKYRAVQAIGKMLEQYGAEIARSVPVPFDVSALPDGIRISVRKNLGGDRFVFCRNESRELAQSDTVVIVCGGEQMVLRFELEPFGAKVLRVPAGEKIATRGEWLPNAVTAAVAPSKVPSERIKTALIRNDPEPTVWQPTKIGEPLIRSGVLDNRYVIFRTKLELDREQIAKADLLLVRLMMSDAVVARVNGEVIPAVQEGTAEVLFGIQRFLRAGANEIELLYESRGTHNFGKYLEQIPGISEVAFVEAGQNEKALDNWELATDLGGVAAGWHNEGVSSVGWNEVRLDTTSALQHKIARNAPVERESVHALATWYRVEFDASTDRPWNVTLDATGNGYIYLNGRNLGRYWEAGPQREYYLPESWLKPAGEKNVLALCLRPTRNGAGLRALEIAGNGPSA